MPPFRDSEGLGRYPPRPHVPLFCRGRSPSARGHFTWISLFHLIPTVIPLIPGIIFRNSGGVGRTPPGHHVP
jgi:hypothetical protein